MQTKKAEVNSTFFVLVFLDLYSLRIDYRRRHRFKEFNVILILITHLFLILQS